MPQPLEFHQLDRRLEHLRVCHPASQRRLLASLAETGQQTPIIVIAQPAAGNYLVIDGHKRIAALKSLRRDTVDAAVWDLSEAEALVLTRSLRMSEPDSALELGWLLAEMESRLGYSIDDLARRFDRSASWVARRLALVETLPEAVQRQVREGKIGAQIAMRYLVPVARVSAEQCQRMAEAFAQRHWTTRQAADLYHAWRDAKGVVRERILAAPELFLKAREQQPPSKSALESDMDTIAAIARRALQQSESPPENIGRLLIKIQQATGLLNQLAQQIKEHNHAEPSPTRDDPGTERPGDQQTRNRAPSETLAPERARGARIQLQRCPEDRTRGESHALPATDPGTVAVMQGESRASPLAQELIAH